jgi:O-acetyl-ADP-ribose deacetylase (regulator of RNase III)
MPILREREGDLLKLAKLGDFEMIVHGANCQNMMGAGIARQISSIYPEALYIDKHFEYPVGSRKRLGRISFYNTSHCFIIANMYTQFYGGANLSYKALEVGFKRLNAVFTKDFRIGIPLIGCGIAGGDWKTVSNIINESTPNLDITLVNYNG